MSRLEDLESRYIRSLFGVQWICFSLADIAIMYSMNIDPLNQQKVHILQNTSIIKAPQCRWLFYIHFLGYVYIYIVLLGLYGLPDNCAPYDYDIMLLEIRQLGAVVEQWLFPSFCYRSSSQNLTGAGCLFVQAKKAILKDMIDSPDSIILYILCTQYTVLPSSLWQNTKWSIDQHIKKAAVVRQP